MAKLIDDTKKNISNSIVKQTASAVKNAQKTVQPKQTAQTQTAQKQTTQKPTVAPVQTNTQRQENRVENSIGSQVLTKTQQRYVDVKEDLTQKYRNNEISINDKNLQNMFRSEATRNWDSQTAKETGRYDEFLKSRVSAEQERFEQENKVARAKDSLEKDTNVFFENKGEDEIRRIFTEEQGRYSSGRSIDDDITDIDTQLKSLNESIKNTKDYGQLLDLYNEQLALSQQKVKLVNDRNTLNEYGTLYNLADSLSKGDEETQKLTADIVNSKDDDFLVRKAKGTEANFIGYIGEALQILDITRDIAGEINAGLLEEIIMPAVEEGIDKGIYSQETYDDLMRMAERSRSFAANDEKNWSTGFYRAVNQLHSEEYYGLNQGETMILQMIDSAEQQAMRTALASMSNAPVKSLENIGLGIMYGQVMSNTYYNLLDKGYTPKQSFLNAVMSASLEIMTEKINIDQKWAMFSGKADQTAAAEILTSLSKHNGSAIGIYATNSFWEGVEEDISEVFQPFIDYATLGTPIEYRAGDFFTAFLSGFGSTMVGAGAGEFTYATTGIGSFVVETKAQYNQLKEDMARAERTFNQLSPSERTQDVIDRYNTTKQRGEAALKNFENLSSVSMGVDTQADQPVVNTDEEVTQNLKDAVTPELLEGNKEYQARQQELNQLEDSISKISQQFLDYNGIDATVDEYINADEPTRHAYKEMSDHNLNTHLKGFVEAYKKADENRKQAYNTIGDHFAKSKVNGAFAKLSLGKNGMNTKDGILVNIDQDTSISVNGLLSATDEEVEAYLKEKDLPSEQRSEIYNTFIKKASADASYYTTAVHEMLHWLKSHNLEAYEQIKSMMKDSFSDADYQKIINRFEQIYGTDESVRSQKDYDYEEEAVAFFIQENLGDAKFLANLNRYSESGFYRLQRGLMELLPNSSKTKMANAFMEGIRTANEQGSREGVQYSETSSTDENVVSKGIITLPSGDEIVDISGIKTDGDGNRLTDNKVYRALIGKKIKLKDGSTIEFVSKLNGRKIINEVLRRLPYAPSFNGINEVKKFNSSVNQNIEESFYHSLFEDVETEVHDHEHLGFVDFDRRSVNVLFDGNVYKLLLKVANLQNGRKIAYAKSSATINEDLDAEYKKATGRNTTPSLSNFKVTDSSEEVKNSLSLERAQLDAEFQEAAEQGTDAIESKAEETTGYNTVQFCLSLNDKMIDEREAELQQQIDNGDSHVNMDVMKIASEQMRTMAEVMNAALEDNPSLLPDDRIGKTLKKDASYGYSVENTTECVRTLAYKELTDFVSEKVGRPLTAKESFLVSQMLYEIAVEPQCLYCYVSLDRKSYNEMVLRYTQERDQAIEKYKEAGEPKLKRYSDPNTAAKNDPLFNEYLNGRKATKNMLDRYNSWIEQYNSGKKFLTAKDIASDGRRTDILNNGGDKASELRDILKYAQAASWAKKSEDYRAYYKEIRKLSKNIVNKLNKHYGLRWYSFSDYTPAFILENMQQFTDAAMKGLKGLAYTKDVDFARIFAPTGVNINISVFAKKNADGTISIDPRQSADIEKAIELRNKYPNVGIVVTGTNDEVIEWAWNQEWSDVVIPFHIVRSGSDIAQYYKWAIYNNQQNDTVDDAEIWKNYVKSLKGDWSSEEEFKKKSKNISKMIYPSEHQNDFATYLRLCAERGLKPRFFSFIKDGEILLDSEGKLDFSKFTEENIETLIKQNPNYMKLVNETRLSEADTPYLQPVFDIDAAVDSFEAFANKGGYFEGWYRDGVNVDEKADIVANDIQSIERGEMEFDDIKYGEGFVDSQEYMDMLRRRRYGPRKHGGALAQFLDSQRKGNTQFSMSLDSKGRQIDSQLSEELENTKVRDEDGNILSVYHGSPTKGISQFEPRRGYNSPVDDYGIYFTNDEQFANDFSYERTPTDSQFFDEKGEQGDVYEAYLNIENPLDFSELTKEDIENLYGYANDFALQVYENRDAFVEDMLHLQQIGNHQLMKGNLDMESIAKDSDYDGVIANLDPRDQSKKEYGVFNSNQIKSVTNANPTSNNDIRYSISLDQDYAKAVESGDMETVQRMVDEEAKKHGYTVKAYHGSHADFTVFDADIQGWLGKRFGRGNYFSSVKDVANWYASGSESYRDNDGIIRTRNGKVYDTYLNLDNAVEIDYDEILAKGEIKTISELKRKIYAEAKKRGIQYDYSVILKNIKDGVDIKSDVYIVPDPNRIKSADPVTYDDDGNVIPLSERFNSRSNDIRYSLSLDHPAKPSSNQFRYNLIGSNDVSQETQEVIDKATEEVWNTGTISDETRNEVYKTVLEETKEEIPVDTPFNGEEMRKYTRKQKISIESLMKTQLRDDKHSNGGYGDFGGAKDWRDYMRSHAKYFNFRREGGTPVDTVFQEFAELYPGTVDPTTYGAKDMLDAMADAIDSNMPRSETRYQTAYGEEEFYQWVDEEIDKMSEDVRKTKEFREQMDSGELKVTDEDLDKIVRRNPISARTMQAMEDNEKIFRENAKSWIPDYDIIREKYDVFSEDVLNDAMYETLMYGHAEPETVQAMTQELVDRLDNVDWRVAESLTNDVNEAVEDMLHYFALDFQYKANQKYIDPVVTRVNNVLKAFDEATDVDTEIEMQKEIVDSLKEAEKFKKSQGDTDLAAEIIKKGVDQKTYTWRTLEQNLDYVANGDMELRNRLRAELELPRTEAQLRRNEIRNQAQEIINKAKELGITAGSDESKIAQFYKEGHTNERDTIDTSTQEGIDRKRSNPWKEYTKEQFDTDTNYKMKNGKTANENIKKVVEMIDDSYNDLILALNMSQTEIYGDVIGQNEYETAQLKAKLEKQSRVVEILKEEMKDTDSVEKQGAYNKALKEYNKLINQLNSKLENDASNDSTRRRFTPLRRNYAHHITKTSLVNDIKGIVKGREAIPTALNGLSENTLPNTASAGFMWAQEGGDYIPDLIESYANYVDEASKVLAYNDYIVKLRQITKDLRATATGNEMSRFTDYLEQYANDIAGKRRDIDRAVDKAAPSIGQAIRVANKLGKRAALMFNVNSALVQVANIPNGLGILNREGGKSYGIDVVKGISDMLNSNREDMKSIIEKSAFMNDRYFDFKTYDNSLKAKIGDLADIMMTVGDKFGAQMIWWSAYEQAIRKGMKPGGSEAIFYADDITRRTTAGRGVGEVPLGLRSNVLNTIAPFQVENNNSWQTFKQNVKGKQLGALVTAGVFSYLLNVLFRFLKRDDVLPEALSPVIDQLFSDEDTTIDEKLSNIVLGEIGEMLSAFPGGSFLTSLSMGKDKADKVFGDYNPSRYGITNIGFTGIGNAAYDAIVNEDGLAALVDLFEGYFPGGKQISRTIEGLQSYGVIPQYNDQSGNGVLDLNNWNRSAKDYNAKGQIKFENDPDDIWGMIQAALFGKWASKSAKEYVDSGFTAYGNTATNISNLLDEMGQSTYTKMFTGNVTGENSQKFVDKLNEMGIYDEYLDKVHEKYDEYLDTVPDGEKPDTFNKFANQYGLTKAVMDGTYEPKESVQTTEEPAKEESNLDFFSFLRGEKEDIANLYDEKANASAEDKEEIQNEIDKKQRNLQNNVYSNYTSSRKMDDKTAKSFQSAMDLDGVYKDSNGNISDDRTDDSKKVRNSEAIETRKALEDMGEYENVLDYIAQYGLEYSDFGLSKTVVGWDDAKFDTQYYKMFGGEPGTTNSNANSNTQRIASGSASGGSSSGSRRSSSSRRSSGSTVQSDLARHSSAVLSRTKNNRYSNTISLLDEILKTRKNNNSTKSYKSYLKRG